MRMNIDNQAKTLLAKLHLDENSVLFGNGETIKERALKKLRKSFYSKDNFFYKTCNDFKKSDKALPKTKVINTPYIEEKRTTKLC